MNWLVCLPKQQTDPFLHEPCEVCNLFLHTFPVHLHLPPVTRVGIKIARHMGAIPRKRFFHLEVKNLSPGRDKPMGRTIRLLLVCSWGASSGVLCRKINEAAQDKGVPLVAEAVGIHECQAKLPLVDVILLEPQIGHHKRDLQKKADAHAIPLAMVNPVAFATMNGEKVLEQAMALASIPFSS
ncbi:hypothetical protein C1X05_14290 [Laceyella sacchari]|nr:hypothetical protein C1X05_14290 [Laceyella sacchari]